MRTIFLLLLCFSMGMNVIAQTVQKTAKLAIFLDCSGAWCDQNFIRSEIKIVDFVNDRTAADLHILITSKYSGYWNQNFQLIFYGQRNKNGYLDTLSFTTKREAPESEKRNLIVQYIKAGIVPLLIKTPFLDAFTIDMKSDVKGIAGESTFDEWNYTVFNLGGDGQYNADQNYSNSRLAANVTIDRTTDKSRVAVGGYISSYHSVYTFEDSTGVKKYTVDNNDHGIFHYAVISLGRHFSIGYTGRYSSSTFTNQEKKFYVSPVIEWNLFPYTDINTRSFVFRYGIDWTHFSYYDTTIYNKVKEPLMGHEASVNINFNQKWGTLSSGAYYRNYFKDPELNSMGANVSFSIRLFAGLSFYLSGSGNIVHDQVYLPKGGATEQEVLIRQRQLKSTFNYYSSGGLYYRFGSKLNNFVNPRITGYRGF